VDSRVDAITVRHLLAHAGGWDASQGFEPMSEPQRVAEALGVPGPVDCRTIIGYMLGQPLDFEPGSRYAYSNFGYCVLGRVIEAVTGESYEDYVRRAILAPAGVERMRLGGSLPADRHEGEVHYYDDAGAPPAEPVFPDMEGPMSWPYGGLHLEAMDAHGGWVGSAVDLARFAYAVDASNPVPILQPATLDAMLSRPPAPLWEGRSDYYALGWRVRPSGRRAAWWATGSMPGTTAVLYRTAGGLTWVALFNARPDASGDAFLVDVIAAMGRAAIADEMWWVGLAALAVLGGGVVLVVRRVRRKRAGRRT
jgi:N-acyl-D-amino-acid deacylase